MDLAGEVSHSRKNDPAVLGRFRRLQLENDTLSQVFIKKTYQNEKSCKVCKVFQLRKAEGLEGLLDLPFLEDSTKRTRFETYQKQQTAYQKQNSVYSFAYFLVLADAFLFGRLRKFVVLVPSSEMVVQKAF